MHRIRVYADVVLEKPLTRREQNIAANNFSTVIRTVPFIEMDGAMVHLEAPPNAGTHEHHSEPGYNCPYCTAMAGDMLNGDNTGVE